LAAAVIDATADRELLAACKECLATGERADRLLSNLRVFVSCVLAVDAGDVRGKELRGELTSLGSRFAVAVAPVELLLARAPEAFFEACVSDPSLAQHRFRLSQERKLARHRLSLPEEKLLAAMAPDGIAAWGSLYDTLGGTLVCELDAPGGKRRLGLSAAASLLRGGDRPLREAAWRAIDSAYAAHEETCAAILNAIAGWRRTEYELRSRVASLHFLDPALRQNRLSARTLDAMMAAVDASSRLGREALALQARAMGVERLEVWDILAGAPRLHAASHPAAPQSIPFEAGLDLVCRAYEAVDPAMAAFARGEAAARRVEGRRLSTKRPGAFCTSFAKSRRTRVCMTYGGSLSEVSTLAHELGHAYHTSLMADIPLPESDYPMSLAETASTLAEAALGELLAREAKDDSALLELGWSDAQDAATFLLNIPARLFFEREFYALRAERPQGPVALGDLMEGAWKRYYGDA
ncbi:MAG: M3 family metallopeptidase, partial [Spirochaetaceae bacterium]|nr:M3 family metallopeptidase [Spirochaetaceae bacterium]